MKNLNIGPRIIIVSFALVVIAIAATSFASIWYFSGYVDQSLREVSSLGMAGLKKNIEADMKKIRDFRDNLAGNIIEEMSSEANSAAKISLESASFLSRATQISHAAAGIGGSVSASAADMSGCAEDYETTALSLQTGRGGKNFLPRLEGEKLTGGRTSDD